MKDRREEREKRKGTVLDSTALDREIPATAPP